MSVLFQIPGIEIPEDMITEIEVTFADLEELGGNAPTLFYNGEIERRIYVNRNCRLIRFRHRPNPNALVNLQFTGANIVPTYRDGTVYGDLRVVSINDDSIVIEDKQIHGGPDDPDVLVGNVSLFYFISSPGGPTFDLRSDPEMINTGRF